ncbi:MAG: hypothetical protein JWQ43_3659 [Glaciihabitans sp.]|nr:hypothetical protein [Glaciihabitans sp.]
MRDGFTLTVGATGDPWFGLSGGLLPSRRTYDLPSAESIGLIDAERAGEELHLMGMALASNLDGFTPNEFSDEFPEMSRERWVEIAQLCKTAGTAVELVTAALCETAGMLALNKDEENLDPLSPMVSAFLLEASMQYLVSVGHNLANIALRLCVESDECRARLKVGNSSVRRILAGVVEPGDQPAGWIYHSQAGQIHRHLSGLSLAPVRCLDVVERIYDAEDWRQLTSARNLYFHRWREGFRGGTTSSNQAVLELQTATVRGAACAGRAIPEFYYRLIDSYPQASATAEKAPLMGPIWNVDPGTGEKTKPLPETHFSG